MTICQHQKCWQPKLQRHNNFFIQLYYNGNRLEIATFLSPCYMYVYQNREHYKKLTYCTPKCVQFVAVILEINFQFLAYMWCPHMGKLPHARILILTTQQLTKVDLKSENSLKEKSVTFKFEGRNSIWGARNTCFKTT